MEKNDKTEEQAAVQSEVPAPVKPKKKESATWKRAKVLLRIFLRFTRLFLIVTLGIVIIAGIILAIVHRAKLSSEKEYLIMNGIQVEVDGRYLHVVKGGPEDLSPALEKTLIGVERHDYGFQALYPTDSALALPPELSVTPGPELDRAVQAWARPG